MRRIERALKKQSGGLFLARCADERFPYPHAPTGEMKHFSFMNYPHLHHLKKMRRIERALRKQSGGLFSIPNSQCAIRNYLLKGNVLRIKGTTAEGRFLNLLGFST